MPPAWCIPYSWSSATWPLATPRCTQSSICCAREHCGRRTRQPWQVMLLVFIPPAPSRLFFPALLPPALLPLAPTPSLRTPPSTSPTPFPSRPQSSPSCPCPLQDGTKRTVDKSGMPGITLYTSMNGAGHFKATCLPVMIRVRNLACCFLSLFNEGILIPHACTTCCRAISILPAALLPMERPALRHKPGTCGRVRSMRNYARTHAPVKAAALL